MFLVSLIESLKSPYKMIYMVMFTFNAVLILRYINCEFSFLLRIFCADNLACILVLTNCKIVAKNARPKHYNLKYKIIVLCRNVQNLMLL